ncbi:MAG: hypothetical protein COW01_10185 [Bdellovibrionales bacterium CG12_big_fil_rev_8_21_14_0_65_38_15]|nr:MAG: hypothetical protein COW79_07030 [Bdellovibrionales bacterium CG22_combo_CG10-13_8_21_14_all_38_13]PIQ54504.1 MAG: hypothetical protein COW01_10185 [Bdellovibrionales bacterium CG12_big_fil_rev_8_21_14_0_65_38_15]PIR29885.1 MAG: hypothetical protein COV38_08030 [Bdellovibrionales bacterium CG11_big_fil_rev_8_21_14_0_20_38_13]
MNNIKLLVLVLLVSSCAFAPMNSSKTARPLLEDKTMVDFGFSPFPYANLSKSVTKRFTISGSIEQQLFPLVSGAIKYSFQDSRDGFSFATELGGSLGMGVVKSYSGFGGPIVSWKKRKFEFYLYPKMNLVYFDKLELSNADRNDLFINEVDPGSITYLLTALGTTFWFEENIGLNIEVKHFALLSKPGEVKKDIIPSIGMMIGFD